VCVQTQRKQVEAGVVMVSVTDSGRRDANIIVPTG